jgi:hypothetical protein
MLSQGWVKVRKELANAEWMGDELTRRLYAHIMLLCDDEGGLKLRVNALSKQWKVHRKTLSSRLNILKEHGDIDFHAMQGGEGTYIQVPVQIEPTIEISFEKICDRWRESSVTREVSPC